MENPSPHESVTVWLKQLKAGDPEAVNPLWHKYYAQLVSVARGRLRSVPKAIADEEDVALSAFDSFCRGVEGGRFPRLDDRDDLWQLLFVITTRKATSLTRRETREKRGSGRVVHASVLAENSGSSAEILGNFAGAEPTPSFAAQVAEECQRLLSKLDDGDLRQMAIWKMEGFTNEEIAIKINRSIPTVERKLARIRKLWEWETPG